MIDAMMLIVFILSMTFILLVGGSMVYYCRSRFWKAFWFFLMLILLTLMLF